MPASPPVTIGVPVRNAERYLAECLDSLLGQTYGDFELHISDNASDDATAEICRDYAARDPRVRYERQGVNLGATGNFNRVTESARGRYFKWAAADDRCAPTYLERCVTRLEADAGAVWCHPLTRHMDPHGREVPPDRDPALPPGVTGHALLGAGGGRFDRAAGRPWQRFRAVVLGTNWCSDAYGLIRTDALRRTRLYLPFFGAEKLLMAELALLGRFAEIPEVLFHQRVHPDAASTLGSRSAERAFARAGAAGRFSSTRLTLLRGYLSLVAGADLPAAERAHCLATLGLYVGQTGKWGRVLGGLFSGRGVGDDTWERIAAATPPPDDAVGDGADGGDLLSGGVAAHSNSAGS